MELETTTSCVQSCVCMAFFQIVLPRSIVLTHLFRHCTSWVLLTSSWWWSWLLCSYELLRGKRREEKRRSKDLLLKSRAAGPAASWACPWSMCICTSCFLMCNCLSLFGAWLACAMMSHADRKHCTKAFSFLFWICERQVKGQAVMLFFFF